MKFPTLSAYCGSATSSTALATIGSDTVSSSKSRGVLARLIIGGSLIPVISTLKSSENDASSPSVIVRVKLLDSSKSGTGINVITFKSLPSSKKFVSLLNVICAELIDPASSEPS